MNPNDTTTPTTETPAGARPRRWPFVGGIAAAVIALGGVGLAVRPEHVPVAAAIAPTPVAALQASRLAAAKGQVAEIYGNKFILQDASGRALVETGPAGDGGALVAKGETVAVEGRFEHGFLHAATLTHGDGKRLVIGPLAPPPGPLERAKERLGLWPAADVAQLTTRVQQAGFTDIRVAGRGPRHLEMIAKDKDGHERELHVDLDGRIQETL